MDVETESGSPTTFSVFIFLKKPFYLKVTYTLEPINNTYEFINENHTALKYQRRA